jgi:iron complex outermembrane receptor protein
MHPNAEDLSYRGSMGAAVVLGASMTMGIEGRLSAALGALSLRGILCAAVALPLWAGATHAQEATTAAQPQVQSAPAQTAIEEVVVTAQRRSERLQDVPISVTAITAQTLQQDHIDNVARLQLVTPGLTWSQEGSSSFPAIRGVRTQLQAAANDPVIGFYIDGVYQSRTMQQNFPFFDVSRVEVQEGPQGTLYGRNTFGGNISVVTNTPTRNYDGGIDLGAGNYGLVQADGFVNVPVNDTLQLRLAADHESHDGYVTSSTNPNIKLNDDDESAVRASALWTPTSKLEVLLHASYWTRDDQGGGAFAYKVLGTLINPSTGLQSINGQPYAVNPTVHNGSDLVHGVDIGIPSTGDAWTTQWDYQPHEVITEQAYTAQISYDLDFATLRSITGYTQFKADRTGDLDLSSVVFPAPGVSGGFSASGFQGYDTGDQALSEELQLASAASKPLQWIAGLYTLQDRVTEPYLQVYTGPTTAANTESITRVYDHAYAGYAQASYYIVPDTLRLIGGIRYSDETKDFDISNYTSPHGSLGFAPTAAQSSGSPTFDKTTWRAGLEYTPTRNMMYYFTASTGFESGGINNNSANSKIPASYAPQTVDAYELGLKNRYFGGRLSIDASLFYNSFNDLQITVLDQTTNLSYTASAGAAFSDGAEFDLKAIPIPKLHVELTAAYLNAHFTQYERPNSFYTATNGDPQIVDLAGRDVPLSPKLKTTLNVFYDVELGRSGVVTPGLTWLHSTSYYTTDYNTVIDRQNEYSTLDLSVRWTSSDARYYVEAYGNNITDTPVLYMALLGNSNRIQGAYGPPATYGVRLGAHF